VRKLFLLLRAHFSSGLRLWPVCSRWRRHHFFHTRPCSPARMPARILLFCADDAKAWSEFVTVQLNKENERQQIVIGGARPFRQAGDEEPSEVSS
jgi:hypothetical protein